MRLISLFLIPMAAFSLRVFADVPRVSDYQFLLRVNFAVHSEEARPLRGGKPLFPVDAKSSTRLLRFDFPAREEGEGIAIPLNGATHNRLLKASVMLRGRGVVHPALRSTEGRAATPAPVPLSESWAWVELTLRTGDAPGDVALELPSSRPSPGDYLEVQRVTVHAAEEQPPEALDVPPRFFNAGDYAPAEGAEGAMAARFTEEGELRGIPFPRTSRPVTLSVACTAAAPGGRVTLLTRDGTAGEVLAAQAVPPGTGWVTFPGLSAAVAGSEISLRVTPAPGDTLEAGRIVFSTAPADPAMAMAALPAPPAVLAGEEAFPRDPKGWWEEALWAHAVPLDGFRRSTDGQPAQGKTAVRAVFGPGGLYLRFDCEEPVLRIAEQRVHEFRAAATTAAGPVDADDYCQASLRVAGGEARFRINANGAIRAERGAEGGAFTVWEPGATGVARREDGRWSAILALPLEALGLHGPEYAIAFARQSVARNERLLWDGGGTAGQARWGSLQRAKEAVPLAVRLPAQWQVGENRIAVSGLEAAPFNEWLCHVRFEGDDGRRMTRTLVWNRAELQKSGGVVPVGIGSSWGGKTARVSVAFLRPDLAPILLPRPERSRIEMPSVSLLPGAGPFRVWLNGRLLRDGNATAATRLTVPLQKGANEITVRLETGPGAVRIEGSGFGPVRWNRLEGPLPAKEASIPKEARWSPAAPGHGSDPVVLRTTLLWEETRLWPTPGPTWFAAEGSAQHFAAALEGAHAGARGWSLCLALPEEIEFVAASGFYAARAARQPLYHWAAAGEERLEERPYRIIRISADKPLPKAGEVTLHERAAALWFLIRPRNGSAGTDGCRLYYWTEAEEGTVTEARRAVPLKILPPLDGRQPRRMHWQMWGPLEQLDSPEARAALLETARRAGITDCDIGAASNATGWLTQAGPAAGVRPLLRVHFLNGSLFFGPYLGSHPEARLVKPDGRPDDSRACTTALLEEAWPEAERLLAEQIRRFRPGSVVYDYEYPPLGRLAMHSCYCPRCLAAFRTRAGLPEGLALDGAAIHRDHAAAWTDFMAWQSARLFRKMKDAVHRADPAVAFEVYSGYQTPENPALYGVDWRYVGQLGAADRATMGYGRPVAAVKATREALNGLPALFGEIIHPFLLRDATPAQPTTAAAQLRRILDSRHGVLLYELGGIDGRSWTAIAETTRLAAAYEPLFLEAKRLPVPGVPEADGVRLAGESAELYCLMNPGAEERTFSFPIPGRKGTEFYTGQTFHNTVHLTVPPGESRAIHVPAK